MANTTETTIIAAFRSANDAQAAASDLQTAGIPRENIYLESGTTSGSNDYPTRSSQHEGGVAGWFKSLFQDDAENDSRRYEQAIGSGNYVLSVDTKEEYVGSIETILNRHNPVNVQTDEAATEGQPAARAAAG